MSTDWMSAIDIREEIEPYLEGARHIHDRIIALSPLRHERTASFYIYTEDTATAKAGYWGDPGAYDPEWRSGGIVKLLARLRNETEMDAYQYLHAKYGDDADEQSENLPKLKPLTFDEPTRYKPLDMRLLDPYRWRHPYLASRGISEPVQRLMRVGFDRERNAIVLPWFHADGTLGTIKYRRVDTKAFWYERGGRPVREMIYGLDVVYRKRLRKVAVCESETDALTIMTLGMPAIATGGAKMWNDRKRDMLLRSPIEEVVLVRDNDAAGKEWRNTLYRSLGGRIKMQIALVNRRYKDINEAYMGFVGNIGAKPKGFQDLCRQRHITRCIIQVNTQCQACDLWSKYYTAS